MLPRSSPRQTRHGAGCQGGSGTSAATQSDRRVGCSQHDPAFLILDGEADTTSARLLSEIGRLRGQLLAGVS